MSGQLLPIEVDCESVQRMLRNDEPFVFIDCREPDEYDTAHLVGTALIPMSEIQQRVEDLESSRGSHIVVHCHHGGRSLRVAKWLRAQGFLRAQSMAGGIDAWAERIDPSIPRY